MTTSVAERAGRRGLVLLFCLALWMVPSASAGPAAARTPSGVNAVTRVVDAFRAFEEAGSRLADGEDAGEVANVVAARQNLLEAAVALQVALRSGPVAAPASAAPGVCEFDLIGVASTYAVDCPLIVDVGGADTYANNAGGTNGGAAAVIDLAGDDRYGQSRASGANGGGSAGAGFLFDAAGNDTYSAANNATNGGGYFFGQGFLLDAGGNDRYTATNTGTNGGGASLASGALIDLGGADVYSAGRFGTNGGTGAGQGLLLDIGGTDSYSDQDTCNGSGSDRSVVPKNPLGAQIDSSNPAVGGCIPAPPIPPLPTLGSVTGRVSDSRTGAGIPGAIVECGGLQSGAPTLVDGRYVIPLIAAGDRQCSASAAGYRSKTQQVTVTSGGIATANFALRRNG
jgi:hypothetical protein